MQSVPTIQSMQETPKNTLNFMVNTTTQAEKMNTVESADVFSNIRLRLLVLIAVLRLTIRDTPKQNKNLNGKHLGNKIINLIKLNMKNVNTTRPAKVTYTITNGCGGKKGTKCGVEVYVMPYAVAKPLTPNRVTDK